MRDPILLPFYVRSRLESAADQVMMRRLTPFSPSLLLHSSPPSFWVRSFSPLFYEGGFRRDSSDVSLMIKALEPSTDTRARAHITLSLSFISLSPSLYISAPLPLPFSPPQLQFQPPFLNEEGYRNGCAVVSHCGSIDGFKTSD